VGLLKFIIKRLLSLIPLLVVVSALVFFLVRLTPSDPINSLTQGRKISEATRQALMHDYHLDKNLPEQYALWVAGVFHGDLGKSYRYRENVTSLLAARLPTTLQLVFMAAVLAIILAIPAGVVSAVWKDSWLDRLISGILVLCVSSPVFLSGIILMLIFALKLPIFPVFGAGKNFVQNLY
jgi:peptide/nickel transport system permease protein